MYPHFIEVHSNKDPQMELMLNVDHINYFYVNEDGVTKIMLSGLRYEEISESYDELKELIRSAGCHIEKGDQFREVTKKVERTAKVEEDEWTEHKMLSRDYGKIYYQHDCCCDLYESPYQFCPYCGKKMKRKNNE